MTSHTASRPDRLRLASTARATTSRVPIEPFGVALIVKECGAGSSSPDARHEANPSSSNKTAPSPRRASVTRKVLDGCSMDVGWNCTKAMSLTWAPKRAAMANPSPVETGGFVVGAQSCPAPPVANTTAEAGTVCTSTSSSC